jgi:FtsZ-binding cell division protein ZapB
MSALISAAMLKQLQDFKVKNIQLAQANQEMANEIERLRAKIAQLEQEKALLPPLQNLEITIERVEEKLNKALSHIALAQPTLPIESKPAAKLPTKQQE